MQLLQWKWLGALFIAGGDESMGDLRHRHRTASAGVNILHYLRPVIYTSGFIEQTDQGCCHLDRLHFYINAILGKRLG